MLTPAVEVKNLRRCFGSKIAVDDLSFNVGKGEVVGFLGPNGAGKSTTLRIIAGLLPANSGCVRVCGHAVTTEPKSAKKKMGYMPETNPLPDELRVSEYLHMRAALKNIPAKSRLKQIDEIMELCDLHRSARRSIIGTLSKGFKQRVGIADTLLGSPDLIIMDEPTIGLDPHQVISIRKLINRLRGKVAVIISSHILSEVDLCCDRVIIINRGRLVGQGTPRQLRRKFLPAREYEIAINGLPLQIETALEPLKEHCQIKKIGEPDADGFRECILTSNSENSILPQIARHLIKDTQLDIGKLLPRAADLEDIFLAATKQSWKEEDQN